jgi:hypothetical protein
MPFPSVLIRESAPGQSAPPATRMLLERKLRERGIALAPAEDENALVVELVDDRSLPAEGYSIARGPSAVRIAGNGALGLLHGMGRFLRTVTFSRGHADPSSVPVVPTQAPTRPLRALYLATHFNNYYQAAPVADVVRYLEDCALWGYNTVVVWFDRHEHLGIRSAAAQEEIARLNVILDAARALGLDVGLTMVANEGYANSPLELRADHRAGRNGYHTEPYDHYHVEICPSQPGAVDLIVTEAMEVIDAFQRHGPVRHVILWPYDQGGCTCAACAPWGANGFLVAAEGIARRTRDRHPGIGIILSTWYFDRFIDGEWSGISKAFQQRPDWVDRLLGGDFGGLPFPEYPRVHGAPGGLPMISFPEVSMNGMTPWGAIGANVRPHEITEMWREVGPLLDGGAVYSEGIFEDLNKAVIAQLMWGRDDGDAIVAEYCAATFGAHVAEATAGLVAELERTTFGLPHYEASQLDHAPELAVSGGDYRPVAETAREIDARLDDDVRSSWRWRLILARCVIQDALQSGRTLADDEVADLLDEITEIYHAQDAMRFLRPPVVRGYVPSGYGANVVSASKG